MKLNLGHLELGTFRAGKKRLLDHDQAMAEKKIRIPLYRKDQVVNA